MKSFKLPSLLLLLLIAISAEAHEGRDCLAQSAGLSQQERTAFLKGCEASASAPVNTQMAVVQQKNMRCEQNAKNKALQGDEKTSYINSCLNKNEAAERKAVINAPAAFAVRTEADSAH